MNQESRKAGKETEPRITRISRISVRELAGYADRVAGIVTCETENHEDLVSECWTAEGTDVARQACHDGNFQRAGQRAGGVAHVKPGGRSTSGSHGPRRR